MSLATRLRPGLCSVTFRQHTPEAIIAAAEVAGIEWGADAHVPLGETAMARLIVVRRAGAGIGICGTATEATAEGASNGTRG